MECTEIKIPNSDSFSVDIDKATPMMKQFLNIKRQNKNLVLLYRMGDFYETFFEDAIIAANILEITLTARDAGSLGKVPMAGIPCKALESYMPRLLEKGYKVGICEQVEDPALAKGLVDRQIVKILTAGTITEPYMLQAKKNNFLAAIISNKKDPKSFGLAYVDITTGEFYITELDDKLLITEISRINPSELLVPAKKIKPNEFQIVPEEVPDLPQEISQFVKTHTSCTLRPNYSFNLADGSEDLKRVFRVNSLEAFGCEEKPNATMAAAAIIDYLEETQKDSMPSFDVITPYNITKYVAIDNITRKNLELTRTARDRSYHGSLLWSIDRTKTSMGGRLIRQWLDQPLQNKKEIDFRLDTVEEFIQNKQLTCNLENILSKFNDLERVSTRVGNNSVNARELVALKDSLLILPELANIVNEARSPFMQTLSYVPDSIIEFAEKIKTTLKDDPSSSLKEGNIIRDGFNSELDGYRELLTGGKNWIADYEIEEKERTGIKSLKVSFNKTFGYYIEITHANSDLVPDNYIRKQTLTNAERYITPELKEYENKVLNAQTKVAGLEYQLFIELRDSLKSSISTIRLISKAIAIIDVLLSFANIANEYNYCKPVIDDSDTIEIIDGRHPVLEQLLPFGSYVPNGLTLCSNITDTSSPQIIILTGPNMAGKSTYMRQMALIAILAQIGSFVPAEYAQIGILDQIFTRVGAVDDLATGQSTFMVEMNETAYILNSATNKSLILLDEIGRGTSTFDGVAIAWSVTEYIAEQIGAKTIFATHYHELNVLEKSYPQIANFRVTIAEKDDEIEFLHKVIPGGASRSYGIQVAKMAGLPKNVINRAQNLMEKLVKDDSAYISVRKRLAVSVDSSQLSLFGE
ncbi:MAG: DNA mismatch repair protein MutS [Cyanobacteriota bacterium]